MKSENRVLQALFTLPPVTVSDVVEAKVCDEGFVNRENEIAENPISGEHGDPAAPVSVAQGSQPVRNLTLI